jgi:hypothetical protein
MATVSFAGFTWNVKAATTTLVAPGPNYWIDSPSSVFVDGSSALHLLIRNDGTGLYPIALQDFEETASGTTISAANTVATGSFPNETSFSSVALGTGATAIFDNTRSLTGSQCATINTGTSSSTVKMTMTSPYSGATQTFRVDVYLTANPAAAFNFLFCSTSASALCARYHINSNGTIGIDTVTGNNIVTTTNSIPLNQWVRIEGTITGNSSTGQASVSIFPDPTGSAIETVTTNALQNTSGIPNLFQFGVTNSGLTNYAYSINDIAIANGAGPVGNPFVTYPFWRCVEVECQTAMGFGRYQWVVDFSVVGDPMGDNLTSPAPSVLNWDDNTVFGLFTYDLTVNGTSGNFFRENDIQFSNFGNGSTQSPVMLATQPNVAAGGIENNQNVGVLTGNGPYTCTFIWQSGQTYFSVVDVNGAICCEHLVSGAAVQTPGTTCTPVMNLWLYGGAAPTKGQQEVIIKSFTFASGTTHAVAQANVFVAPFIASSNMVLIHRPGPDASETLNPVIPIGATDVPNKGISYLVQSLVPGINARARGTYSVVLSSFHWDSPDTARLLEVVVIQQDFAGAGALQSGQYFPGITRNVTPTTDAFNGLVDIGEVTLPVREIPPDNTDALFIIKVSSANTLDRFQDVLLLDTMGQTTLITPPQGTAFHNYYVDEPDSTADVGRVSGSVSLRNRATSVLATTRMSGGPLTADPGSGLIIAYGIPQAPGLSGTYSPRYWADRVDS